MEGSRTASGRTRKTEIELKEYKRTVIDIDQAFSRRVKMAQINQMSNGIVTDLDSGHQIHTPIQPLSSTLDEHFSEAQGPETKSGVTNSAKAILLVSSATLFIGLGFFFISLLHKDLSEISSQLNFKETDTILPYYS